MRPAATEAPSTSFINYYSRLAEAPTPQNSAHRSAAPVCRKSVGTLLDDTTKNNIQCCTWTSNANS